DGGEKRRDEPGALGHELATGVEGGGNRGRAGERRQRAQSRLATAEHVAPDVREVVVERRAALAALHLMPDVGERELGGDQVRVALVEPVALDPERGEAERPREDDYPCERGADGRR